MLATLDTAVISGLRGELVRVEVDVTPGLPVCHIVGLPDAALSEARERVRGAIRNSGFEYPLSRITVNLAPADRRKRGAAYDVAIAVGILVASGQIRASGGSWALLGELSLGGAVMPVPGVLPMVATLARAGHRRICVPSANLAEARVVDGVEAVAVEGLDDAARLVAGPRGRVAARASRRGIVRVSAVTADMGPGATDAPTPIAERAGRQTVDLAEVRGQDHARWALEVALAGRHNMLMVGPPGAGKTLLGRAIPGLLTPLDEEEAQEVAVIRSVAGLREEPGSHRARPYRSPHHTTSYAAMVGGGPQLAPGLVTLAHRGVLFLDELAEFDRPVLDALRQPLEDGSVEIVRAHGAVRYPARVQVIAAMNPCRCGWWGDLERACRCPVGDPERYVRRVSGPLLDRLDVRVAMPRIKPEHIMSGGAPEDSATVRARVVIAWSVALARNRGLANADLPGGSLVGLCGLGGAARACMIDLARRVRMSARGVHRVLRVARTIADLAGRDGVTEEDLMAAASLRLDPLGGETEAEATAAPSVHLAPRGRRTSADPRRRHEDRVHAGGG